jgi:hypothetical protein
MIPATCRDAGGRTRRHGVGGVRVGAMISSINDTWMYANRRIQVE